MSDIEDDPKYNSDDNRTTESISDDGSLSLDDGAIELMDDLVDRVEATNTYVGSTDGGTSDNFMGTDDAGDGIDSHSIQHDWFGDNAYFEETNTIDSVSVDQVATVSWLDATISNIISECNDFVDELCHNQLTTPSNCMRLWTRVFGDAFHLMDRIKVPINHAFKSSYFQALRSAMFIFDSEDLERVKQFVVTEKKQKWSNVMVFNFRYIALRVKRIIPPPKLLHSCVKAVFDFFGLKLDPTTNQALFNEKAWKKSKLVLESILKGSFSDPIGMNWYVPKTDDYGKPMKDKDGLTLYCSLRGTSIAESMHQNLTRSFGHTISGPENSDCLLALIRHAHNWSASERNRPDFPLVGHYDGTIVVAVNTLHEDLLGEPKFSNWHSCLSLDIKHLPYGVVSL